MPRTSMGLWAGYGLVALTLAVSLSALARPAHAGVSAGFTPAEQAAMRQILAEERINEGAPGIAADVWVPGRGSFVQADGTSDIATGDPLSVVDRFRIASVTKTFVATALLQLVDRGRVSLGDPLSKYVRWPRGRRIPIRTLLNQTSGIYSFVEDPEFASAFDADPLLAWSAPRDGLRIARKAKPYFPPGEGFHYSETNYYLAGVIIEKVTGKRVERVIQHRILDRLGMFDTRFASGPALREPFSHGYTGGPDALRDVTATNPHVPWAAGAMVSTLGDLRIWAKALGTGDPLLRDRTQRARLPNVVLESTPVEVKYGLGMFSVNGFLGHNGAILGYSTTMLYLPETGATIITWDNEADDSSEQSLPSAIRIAALLYPELFPGLSGSG